MSCSVLKVKTPVLGEEERGRKIQREREREREREMDGGQCGDRATSCLTTPRYEDLPSPSYLAHSFRLFVIRTFLLRDTLHILLDYSLSGPSFSKISCTFFYITRYQDSSFPRILAQPSYDTHCRFFSTTIYPNKFLFLEERTPRKYQSRTFPFTLLEGCGIFSPPPHHCHHHHEVRLHLFCKFCLGLTHPDSHFLC